jgi:tetratricopeptide (TPR) repeat protein
MISKPGLYICLLGAVILCGNAYAMSPVKIIKSPINYVKELMGFKKEIKDKAVEIPAVIEGSEDEKQNRFKRGYGLFTEKDYQEAAIELYRFMSMSNHDEEDYEWAQFFFGICLNKLKFFHAANDVLGDLITRKPNPRIVTYSFELLEKNVSTLPHDEEFIVSQVVGDQDYGFVEGDIADFVNYLQGVYDWEHRFKEWGNDHFKKINPASKYYYNYIYKQAIFCVYENDIDGAIDHLKEILRSNQPSVELKDESRKTLARLLYEKGDYDNADMIYMEIDKNIVEQADNLLERAWVHYRLGNSEKAMGLLYSFQAPSFENAFRPEYFILKSFIYKDVCNYKNALYVVNEFKDRYGEAITKLYERTLPQENTQLMMVLLNKPGVSKTFKFLELLENELELVKSIPDELLKNYLIKVYELQIEESSETLRKQINDGYEMIANDLLKYEEDAYLMEYEIGLDMYQRVYESQFTEEKTVKEKVEKGLALYKFQGEFWNDELETYEVTLQNKCENMEEWDIFFK